MSDKAWEQLIDLIETKYGVISIKNRHENLEDKPNLKKNLDEIIFVRNDIDFKIVRTISPRIIDKKTIYRSTANASRIENVYDPEETVSKVNFYKKADADWQEIKPEELLN